MNPDEPKRTPHLPSPPRELSERARREWRKLGKELVESGLLTSLDKMAFAAMVTSWTRWLEATEALDKTGMLIKGQHGPQLNPLLRVARDAQAEYTRMCAEFGLTPSASARVRAAKVEEKDPFEEYMKAKEQG